MFGFAQFGHCCLWSPGHVRGGRRVVAPSNELLTQTIPSQHPKPACDQHRGRHPWHYVCSLVASAPKSVQCTPRGRKRVETGDQSLSHFHKTQETLGILGLRAKLDSWHKTLRKRQASSSGVCAAEDVRVNRSSFLCSLWWHPRSLAALTCCAEKPLGQPGASTLIYPYFLFSFE